ncbi:MAG TPA: NADH-quinone oxidoreductase subunit H, partial [Candidatus Limnocylindrales bacterium]
MDLNAVATTAFLTALQLAVFLAFAPFLAATIRRTKALLQSRRGPGLLQPYRDLVKWWGKLPLESNASGPVSRYAPAFVLGAVL